MTKKLFVFIQNALVSVALTGLMLGSTTGLNSAVGFGQVVHAETTTTMIGGGNPSSYVYEFGKCIVDYTESLPDGVESIVDGFVSYFSGGLQPEHHDVYRKIFANFDDVQTDEQIGNTVYRGFYACGNDLVKWFESMRAWFFENRRVVYVNGHMIDKDSRSNCNKFALGYETLGGSTFTYVGHVNDRWGVAWSKFHLFTRNCQHWAKFVQTGTE